LVGKTLTKILMEGRGGGGGEAQGVADPKKALEKLAYIPIYNVKF
jgi:hypothetical protein